MQALKVSMTAISLSLLMACSPAKKEESTEDEQTENMDESTDMEQVTAMATLNSASGSSVTGTATFTQVGDMTVKMLLEVEGLTPGVHALHLHENGDCSAPDGSSAGGHWNPGGMDHGQRGGDQYHAGDVINLTAGEDGKVSWSDDVMGWTIGGDEATNIMNRGIIIHAQPDDFTTQPTGAAGGRVACGVIQEGNM